MKKSAGISLALILLTGFANAASAAPCENGQCTDRAWVFNDLLSFSRALPRCATFSNPQALELASAAVAGRLNYEDFKDVYTVTCNSVVAERVSAVRGRAALFLKELSYSQSLPRCATFNNEEALTVANQLHHQRIDMNSFEAAYARTCNLQTSLSVAQSPPTTSLFLELLSYSAALPRCATFNNEQALSVANQILSRQIDKNSFEAAYARTCSLQDSVSIAQSPASTNLFLDLLSYSAALPRCATFSTEQAAMITSRVQAGEIVLSDFKLTYQNTCDLNASLAAARCLTH